MSGMRPRAAQRGDGAKVRDVPTCRLVQRRRIVIQKVANLSSQNRTPLFTSLARPSSVAGISMPSALTFENIGMLPIFHPKVYNGWSFADIAERLANVRF